MKTGRYNPHRFDIWGDSMLNKLPSVSRKRRKRDASKKRRLALRREFPPPSNR